ncbi:hypothetical protein SETIT_1G200000v2 [Setaria italica]|uniref:Uncharacterized protein n=1 Tax=Setaria italica TaxID=4555 RepID=A0A368PN31_SETIT|nr:hypothetical protein SETIT_1G200000v2 [Setaria italica]
MIKKYIKPDQKLAVGSLEYKKIIEEHEMVNDDIIEVVWLVYNCDYCVDKHSETLHKAGKVLKRISDINSEDWDLLKLATALKMVCYPEELLIGDPRQIFSGDEHINLRQDAPLYKDKLWGRAISIVYNQILRARIIRHKWRRRLPHYLKEVKEAYEAEQSQHH